MSKSLKTLYRVELDFRSPLHLGKGSQGDYLGASEIIHDGSGEFIVPGSSIAGVFFATMQNCILKKGFSDKEQMLWQQNITQEPSKKDDESQASRFIFRSSTLNARELKVRDKVKINRKTKTTEENAKFSLWEIDPGKVKLLIEIDNVSRKEQLEAQDFDRLESWAETAFYSWQEEGVFFGAHSGTGSGYARLTGIEKFQLDAQNFEQYLKLSYHNMLEDDGIWEKHELTLNPELFQKTMLRRYTCTVKTGLNQPLLVKGGSAYKSAVNPETDAAFISRADLPFIPGSSFRGALSSLMDKYDQTEWKTLLGQPKDNDEEPDQGGCLIFTDLYLDTKASEQMELMQIERHAEDQFSRAIWGKGKFVEERIFNAVFQGEIIVLACERADSANLDALFSFLKQACNYNLISLGSGGCHPKITLEEEQ